jgi:hypothetical protein
LQCSNETMLLWVRNASITKPISPIHIDDG